MQGELRTWIVSIAEGEKAISRKSHLNEVMIKQSGRFGITYIMARGLRASTTMASWRLERWLVIVVTVEWKWGLYVYRYMRSSGRRVVGNRALPFGWPYNFNILRSMSVQENIEISDTYQSLDAKRRVEEPQIVASITKGKGVSEESLV